MTCSVSYFSNALCVVGSELRRGAHRRSAHSTRQLFLWEEL